MHISHFAFVFPVVIVFTFSWHAPAKPSPGRPGITRANKSWTRWWWPGSALDKASITHQLEQLAAPRIGGVEITPIYRAKALRESKTPGYYQH